ncbi:hypothetical protein EG329_000567 [Mollisiaceae sp. DMI_Dod_QoI]|nr:hypothetical protein EG329_000567 [Helotiales sp. DMI_Dod_QoI]
MDLQCDQRKPRYIFKETSRSAWSVHDRNSSWKTQQTFRPRTPSNETTVLTNALVTKLKALDDIRYHLSWTYGGFIDDIPRRIGTNEALDAAVAALVSAHSTLASRRVTDGQVSFGSLAKYSYALKTLRLYLNDRSRARKAETLCAVMLLLICQSFLGTHTGCRSAHGEGAAQIIKARSYYDTQDEFECKLLLSLRGPVLFEALINPKICFGPEEWSSLVANELDGTSYEGLMMHCLARAPDIMERGRTALREQLDLYILAAETRHHYSILKTTLAKLHDRLYAAPEFSGDDSRQSAVWVTRTHAYFQRSYGLGLAICLVFNCILKALDASSVDLDVDSMNFCEEVLSLADQAAKYRPLGASFVTLCLIAAWCASTNLARLQAEIKAILLDYRQDFTATGSENLEKELIYSSQRLSLRIS